MLLNLNLWRTSHNGWLGLVTVMTLGRIESFPHELVLNLPLGLLVLLVTKIR